MASSSTLPEWFSEVASCFSKGDIDGWMTIYAQDAVHEFPFAPPGRPKRLEGKEEIGAHLKLVMGSGRFKFGTLENVRVYGDLDKETIIEADGHHTRADGTPFEISYVWIIVRREGKVVHIRDYMNPLQLATV